MFKQPIIGPASLPALLLVMLVSSGLPSSAWADEAVDQYAVAAGHYSAGRWQLALDEFDVFLASYPRHERADQVLFYAGESLAQLGRFADARQRFEKLIARAPAGKLARKALFRSGEAAYLGGDHPAALLDLAEFVHKYSDDPLCAYAVPYLAQLRIEAGEAAEAERLFALALEKFPDGPLLAECRLGQARAWAALERTDKARRTLRELAETEKFALADQAQFYFAALENATGEFDTAAAAFALFETKFASSPLKAKAQLGRGWALFKLARFGEAEKCFAAVAEHAELASSARHWLGLTLAAEDRWADAIGPLAEAERSQSDPERVMRCRAALAVCYARQSRWEDARRSYGAFQQSQPPTELWNATTYELAEAAYAAGQRDWSGDLFTSLTKAGNAPEYVAKGLSGLAWSQLAAADDAGSAATFDRLLAEYPDDALAPEAALLRSRSLEKLGQSDLALAMLELVIEKYPASKQFSQALWRAARLHHKLGQDQQAEVLFRRLADQQPPFTPGDSLLYQWATVLAELERGKDAQEVLERLRREWPHSPLAIDAAYRLSDRALALKQYDDAAALLREVVAADPPVKILPHALYLQGRIAMEREQWAEVAAPLERLKSDFPTSELVLPARYWIAEAIYRQREYASASEAFAALARDSRGRSEPWLAMVALRHAQSLAQLNEWPAALAAAQAIEHDYPRFEQQYEADYVVGRALAGQAEFAKAREAYAKVIRSPDGAKTETAAMAQWMIGESYFHQENYQAAQAAYLRVEILYAFPRWQAGGLLQAGKCQEMLGDWKDAVETYSRLIARYPETEFTDEAKRRLGVAQQRAAANQRRT